jgi:hypothetical protein
MKLKIRIKFAEETRFDAPVRPMIRHWTQYLFGTQYSIRSLALAELPKSGRRGND